MSTLLHRLKDETLLAGDVPYWLHRLFGRFNILKGFLLLFMQ